MLILAGIGVHDCMDISLKAVEECRKADVVYAELYTSKVEGFERLKEIIGRDVTVLERGDIEERADKIIEEAERRNVVLLTPGDPMVATTHSALRLEAEKRGVGVKVVHASSIASAVCVTGLQFYRFGRTATVSWPLGSTVSRYPVDVVNQNWKINAHTLLLLDLNPPMKVPDAVELLFRAGMEDWFAVALSDAGGKNEMKCSRLSGLKDFDGEGLHSLIVLARTLHFMEYECLRVFACAPEELEGIVE